MTHPAKWNAVKNDAIVSSYWGVNLLSGGPEMFNGYRVIPHPGMLISATYWAAMFDPAEVVYANSGQIAIDLNPLGSGWHSNETALRVFTHSDWEFGSAAHYSKADYT
jgi:hypothetical protein